ncbi:MAG TPA: ion channel [Casimicrobiaceae bacterium]|nr:ion channel [Casimicrobiaceae bacterium]
MKPNQDMKRPNKSLGVSRRIGGRRVTLLGGRRYDFTDLYHLILTLSWSQFFALVFCFYLAVNAIFALVFLASSDSITNARPGSFADAFFFSIETLATVGYGYMNPHTMYGHTVASVEILVGIMIFAVVTGLVFARFSRPTARVIFSRNAVIDSFNGQPTLMLRAGNQRQNQILEASANVSFVRDETTSEGQPFRRLYDLLLVRSRSPAFALSWTIMHTIDATSPLHGLTQESLRDCTANFAVTISGLDETIMQAVHARHDYTASDILLGHRFVDLFVTNPDGEPVIDLSRIDDVTPIAA